MRDLRKQALESHKTVSRKARSRVESTVSSNINSRTNSPAPPASRTASCNPSRNVSRNPSRHGSDDEDYTSEGGWSANSIDDILNSEDVDVPEDAWKSELGVRIEQITNLKRSSTEGRTESLHAYTRILIARFAQEEIETHILELMRSILRSIKQETTEEETVKAIKALAVTMLSYDCGADYDAIASQLTQSIKSSTHLEVKVNATYTLAAAAIFCEASSDEVLDIMTLMLEIIESDGASIEAQDEANVVTAALQAWGLLATRVENLEDETESAMEAFIEQLESADAGVQIATGENIALLYESSLRPLEENETLEEDDDDDEYHGNIQIMVPRYQVWRRQDQLLHTLNELANASSRRISKKDRKALHASFADIHNSVERPERGPGFSMALAKHGMTPMGSRLKYKTGSLFEISIDKWWKLHRLNAMRRILQGGFSHHYEHNPVVSSVLPFSRAGFLGGHDDKDMRKEVRKAMISQARDKKKLEGRRRMINDD